MASNDLLQCAFCRRDFAKRWEHEQICKMRNGCPLPDRQSKPDTVKSPCRFCGKMLARPGRHEVKCKMGDGTKLDRRLAYLHKLANRGPNEIKARASKRRMWALSQLDLERPLGTQLDALGIKRRTQSFYVQKWREEGILPRTPNGKQVRRSRGKTADLDEEAKRIFKMDLVFDRPLAIQLRERGYDWDKDRVNALARRAKSLGLLPLDHRYPTQDPLRPKTEPKKRAPRVFTHEQRQREYELRRIKTAQKRPSASNVITNEKATAPKSSTGARQPKFTVTHSALITGDGVKEPCPYGCGQAFNSFRMQRHVKTCDMREDDE
jgi:hypothetical protein